MINNQFDYLQTGNLQIYLNNLRYMLRVQNCTYSYQRINLDCKYLSADKSLS